MADIETLRQGATPAGRRPFAPLIAEGDEDPRKKLRAGRGMFPSPAIYAMEPTEAGARPFRIAGMRRAGETSVMHNRDDEQLRDLLHAWQPQPPDAGDLRRGVWRRIEAAPESRLGAWLAWTTAFLARPAFASAVVGAALALGIGLGAGASASLQTQDYVRSLSPYAHRR